MIPRDHQLSSRRHFVGEFVFTEAHTAGGCLSSRRRFNVHVYLYFTLVPRGELSLRG